MPRSGKSRVAARLAQLEGLTHYPLDSLVSTLGEVFPALGVGRQYPDPASTVALAPFLRAWIRHLDFEGAGYVLEGYHVAPQTAAILAGQDFHVAALGYATVDPVRKGRTIREFARPQDWTAELTAGELTNLVNRYRTESADLRTRCEALGLAYFEEGVDAPGLAARVLSHLRPES